MGKRIFLLTGFLGSGKTTFLDNVLKQMTSAAKAGVIVNEFGRTGIDGQLIVRDGLEIHELTGGSIFCACLKENFVKALETFLEMPLDILFIESSGLADPAGFHRLARFVDKHGFIESVEVICLIDCKYFPDQLEMFGAVETQILSADRIVLNKTDLVQPEQLAAVQASVRQLAPSTPLYEAVQGKIPLDILATPVGAISDLPASEQPAYRPFTHTLLATAAVSCAELRAFLTAVAEHSLRIKGFLFCLSGGERQLVKIDVVGKTVNILPFEHDAEPKLVIIARSALPINRTIQAIWSEHCRSKIRLV